MNYQPTTQFSMFPPAVKHLLIINVICFVALNTPGIGDIIFAYFAMFPWERGIGLIPGAPYIFYPWQLITYMFLHGSLGHIFFNLFALWIFGTAIENTIGTKKFAQYYFLTGVGAGILHFLITGSGAAVIGASGAVFGLLLAFGMMFPNREIFFLFIPVPIKAKYFVIMYGAFELMMGVSSLQTGIAHFAHLGGMVVGFFLIRYWKLPTNLY